MLTISEYELDTMASFGGGIHLALFGLSAGAVVTLGSVLAAVTIADPRMFAGFVAATIVSGVCALYFGAQSLRDYSQTQRRLKEMKR